MSASPEGSRRAARSREFTDALGVLWKVREVVPAPLDLAQRQVHAQPFYQRGWLLFESADGDQRRFVPYPRDWIAREDADLAAWCAEGARARHQQPSPEESSAAMRRAERAGWR